MTGMEVFGNRFYSISDKGLVREKNEDCCKAGMTPNGFLCVLCDGMGGHAGGETASRMAVEKIWNFWQATDYAQVREAMGECLRYANSCVWESARGIPGLEGMGTTVCMALLRGKELWYAHVGDSRIYVYEPEAGLCLLTKDHSMVQGMVDQGLLSEAEARVHPDRNRLVKVLGGKEDVEPDVCASPFEMENGMSLLVCSDGLSSYVPEEAIGQVLAGNGTVHDKCSELVALANQAGGEDNVTVQLLAYGSAEAGSEQPLLALARPRKRRLAIKIIGLLALIFALLCLTL